MFVYDDIFLSDWVSHPGLQQLLRQPHPVRLPLPAVPLRLHRAAVAGGSRQPRHPHDPRNQHAQADLRLPCTAQILVQQ